MKHGIFHPGPEPAAIIRNSCGELWRFTGLKETIRADSTADVLNRVKQACASVEEKGLYAAGFVSYEAAPGFDSCFEVQPDDSGFPLIWFGLFSGVHKLEPFQADAGHLPQDLVWEASISPEDYACKLAVIKEHIRNGNTYQVNFTYRLQAGFSSDPWQVFKFLYKAQNPPFAAYIDTGDFAVCSLSPELFFSLNKNILKSRPMKGTTSRGLWPEQDMQMADALRCSKKNRAENVMIVDMVRNDMGRIAVPGSVQVPELFSVERYQDVWQMTSLVQADATAPVDRIFQALFPPASITGAPKIMTMKIISDLESGPRRIYTGSIGFMSPGRQARFNVAIRTLLVDKRRGLAEYGVGGGIVWDSSTDKEMDESRIKAKVLESRTEAFELLESMHWNPDQGFPFLHLHLRRLKNSADYFGFPLNMDLVRDRLDRLVQNLPPAAHKIRLLISSSGELKEEAIALKSGSFGFSALPLADTAVDPEDKFLYHKTTRRNIYEHALKTRPGFRDVLLYNIRGEVTESTIANIVVEKDDELLTPPVHCGLLPGVYRSWLLEKGWIREEILSIDEVMASTCVYLINAVRGMHRVSIVGTKQHRI